MKIAILSTSPYGTLGHHLPSLFQCKDIEVTMVIVAPGLVASKSKRYKRLFKKILKIGVLGAMNGVKMRKWYTEDIKQYTDIANAETFCKEHNIPFATAPSTNSPETQHLLRESGAEVALSLGNGYINQKVFSIPRYGMVNIHHEVLPQYQNAQSIIWEIYNGSTDTGYTIHKINKEIDKGEVLYQEKLPIVFRDTLADTVAFNYARLFDASAKGLVKLLSHFDEYYRNAKPQGKGTSYTTPSYRQFMKIEQQFKKLKG
jgi:methionyl-tRNA formyltransferase